MSDTCRRSGRTSVAGQFLIALLRDEGFIRSMKCDRPSPLVDSPIIFTRRLEKLLIVPKDGAAGVVW